MVEELPEEIQRRTPKRRTALIVSIVRGETSVLGAILSLPPAERLLASEGLRSRLVKFAQKS